MSAPGPARAKVRVRFRKGGDLRLVSHHDLMKCFERMFRRAALPVYATRGFHPKPRMVFALSLALGVVGCAEVLELELRDDLSAEEVHAALARQAPAGLEILSVKAISLKQCGQARRICYRVALPPGRADDLPRRITELLARPDCWVERQRPQRRRLNVRPCLRDVRQQADGLEIDLWVTPTGTARPEEILDLLGLGDLPAAGAVLERTLLELDDETHEPGPQPEVTQVREDAPPPAPVKPARPTALLPGPLSFDS